MVAGMHFSSGGFFRPSLALACSIDRSYMGRIERGEVNIIVEKLYVIADVLGSNPCALLPESMAEMGFQKMHVP